MKYESKVGMILEEISKEITSSETFADTPIFYDFIEVSANNVPPACIIYKALEWQMDDSNCNYERQLDIIIAITTEEMREGIVGQLFSFSEKLKAIIDEYSLKKSYLTFLGGSSIHGKAYNRKGEDSYKQTPELFTSMVVLSYLLRY